MKKNRFSDTFEKIKKEDVEKIEERLSVKFPESFVNHYMRYNGGVPDLDWIPGVDNFEPTIVQEFYPMFTDGISYDLKGECMLEHYFKMLEMNVIRKELLPFAVDPGGNFYALNLIDETIHYVLTEGKGEGGRIVSNDFSSFLNSLTDEDGAYISG